jgi:asparagine synthase (glutamine-hydrolysing)
LCGIVGWFSLQPATRQESETRLEPMLAAVAHRGPDGTGRSIDPHAALAHARLAIIDPESGQQPITSLDGEIVLVCNGEIYNYRALRAELAGSGYRFRTGSDSEVIIALYQRYGWRGFSRLRGMYAFALWDRKGQSGLLVRDPLGIKPLFCHIGSDRLLFASEAKGILAAGHQASLDPAALHLVLNFRYLPGNGTLFHGIGQLAPGEVLLWQRDGSLAREQLPEPAGAAKPDLLEAIRESVDLHMTADVEVGAYLSGGIDSATIVALARDKQPATMQSFTLAVGDDPAEATNAARTARLLGVENLCGEVSQSAARSLPGLIHKLELPKVNAWQIEQLAMVAAGRVKVALSGLGGDELFLGYNLHRFLARGAQLHSILPQRLTRIAGSAAAPLAARFERLPWSEPERAMQILGRLGEWPRVYGLLRNIWDNPFMRQQLYGPRLLDSSLPDAFDTLKRSWPAEDDPVVAAARFEWQNKMVNDLLWQEDRCSMAHGVEVRVPLVDQQVARSVASYNRYDLMPGGKPKGLMRSLLTPLLPSEILNRKKSGFQVDAATFFRQELTVLADYWLSDEQVRAFGLFNPLFVQAVLKRPPSRLLRWHYFLLYLMLGTHLWVAIFEQGHNPGELSLN